LRIAQFFDVSAVFWLNLQMRLDLYKAQRSEKEVLNKFEILIIIRRLVDSSTNIEIS
jgi:plasmid maintenance system antidote protein VapI